MKTIRLMIIGLALVLLTFLPHPGWAYDAMLNWGNGKAYFLEGNIYSRYDLEGDHFDSNYPRKLSQFFWPGLWENLSEGHGIGAAVNWGNGKAYLFRGNEFIQYDIDDDESDPGFPKKNTPDFWPGLWKDLDTGPGIDAVVNWGNGKVYFFRANEYLRFDIKGHQTDPGFPKRISEETWPGLWQGGIASAINWGNGKVDFINDLGEVIRYDVETGQMSPGYPQLFNLLDWPVLQTSPLDTPPTIIPYHEDRQNGFLFLLICLALLPVAPLYLLPAILARHDKHFKNILFLTLFGGWTLVLWGVALIWATRYATPSERRMSRKIRMLHDLLFDNYPYQTLDYVQQHTRWFKREIIQIVAYMVEHEILKEELDMETGAWYYYVPSDLEEHKAHLSIAERAKRHS